MKILLIIINMLFLLLGIGLLADLSLIQQFFDLLVLILTIYTATALSLAVLKDILLSSFPRYIGILLGFAFLFSNQLFKDYTLFEQNQLNIFLLTSSTVIVAHYFLIALIDTTISINLKRIKTSTFRKYYWPNYLLYIILFGISLYLLFFINAEKKIKLWQYALAVLFCLYPFVNRGLIRHFITRLKKFSDKLDLNITLNQVGKLARIKNFVFAKDKIIETNDYQLIDSNYRSTVKVLSAIQLSHQLANDWDRKYTKLFVNDEFEKVTFDYKIVQQNEDGISVIDDQATMYHFGKYTYVKDKIKKDDKTNLYLLKNDLVIAKYTVNEKIDDSKAELVNQLDYFGNTMLFYSGIKEDLGRDYNVVFDKVYSGLNERKQKDLLSELSKRAPTAYFTAKTPKEIPNDLCFYVTKKTGIEKNDKLICCDTQSLFQVPSLISYSKKVRRTFKYALISSLIVQILLIVFAIISYRNLLLILSANLGLSVISAIIIKLLSKRIHQLPDQPANLAHNHQAA